MLLFGPVRPLSYRSFSKPRSPRVSGHGEGRRRDFEMVAVAVVAVVAVGPDDSHFTQTQRHKVATSLFPHPSLSSSPVWALKTGCDASFETKKDTIIIPRPQHLTRSSTIRPEQLLQLWLIGSGHWAARARQQIPASSNKALAFSFASLHLNRPFVQTTTSMTGARSAGSSCCATTCRWAGCSLIPSPTRALFPRHRAFPVRGHSLP